MYVPRAVHADGATTLTFNSPFPNDSNKFILSFYIRCNADQYSLGSEIMETYDNGYFSVYFKDAEIGMRFLLTPEPPLHASADIADSSWHHVLATADISAARYQIYVDGTDCIDFMGSPFPDAFPIDKTIPFNTGESAIIILGDGYGDNLTGDISQFQFYLGKSLDFSQSTNLALFWSGGAQVDPAQAIAVLGDPEILFDGDSASFATNQGTLGAFVLNGTLVDTDAPV